MHCCPYASPRRSPEQPRQPPPAVAEPPRRQLLRASQDLQPTLGEHARDPEPFPGQERRWSHRISGEPAASHGRGTQLRALISFQGLSRKVVSSIVYPFG
jgi:hypothetical protein